MVEKKLLLGQIIEIKILMDLHVLKLPWSENPIFSGFSICMRLSVNSIVQKLNVAELQTWHSPFVPVNAT